MKKIIVYAIWIIGALLSVSFIMPSENIRLSKNEIAIGDTLFFRQGPLTEIELFKGSYRRGSYDGTKYYMIVSSAGELTISELKGSSRANQSELNMYHGQGFVTRNGDTVLAHSKTLYTHFYLIDIDKGVIDSFSQELELELISKTLNNAYCPIRVSTFGDVSFQALPKGMKDKEFSKPIHLNKSIGVFSHFLIRDSKGKRKNYPEGDYILVGGNSQIELK